MKILYLYNGEDDKTLAASSDTTYSYSLNAGRLLSKDLLSLNDADELNRLALQLRDDYSSFIFSLNERFLRRSLTTENSLSLFFLSDLSNKRTEHFMTFDVVCHILLLLNKLNPIKLDLLVFDGCPPAVRQAFQSAFPTVKSKEIHSQTLKKRAPLPVRQFAFFLGTFIKIIFLKLFITSQRGVLSHTRIFMGQYPKLLKRGFIDEKYGDMVTEKDSFLITLITDALHQTLKFPQFFRAVKSLRTETRNSYIILDSYVSALDILSSFLKSITISIRARSLKSEPSVYRGINLTALIALELEKSILRIPRLLMYKNSLKRVFSVVPAKEFVYYLHEFCYGRFFTWFLGRHFPALKLSGFQSGTFSNRKLLCFLAKGEGGSKSTNALHHLPLPDAVYAEDHLAKEIYEISGYRNVEVMKDVPRLKGLARVVRPLLDPTKKLVAGGLHDSELLLKILSGEIKKSSNVTYYFKAHPRGDIDKVLALGESLQLPNLEFVSGPVEDYYQSVGEVIVTYSSVGYEAHRLGIPARTINLPFKVNESPLLDIDSPSYGA